MNTKIQLVGGNGALAKVTRFVGSALGSAGVLGDEMIVLGSPVYPNTPDGLPVCRDRAHLQRGGGYL